MLTKKKHSTFIHSPSIQYENHVSSCIRSLQGPLSLEDVIDLGFDRILTSGGYPTAPQGANMIKNLIVKAGQRIIIMPGSGITENNIQQLAVNTNMKECHGSFRSMYPFSPPTLTRLLMIHLMSLVLDD